MLWRQRLTKCLPLGRISDAVRQRENLAWPTPWQRWLLLALLLFNLYFSYVNWGERPLQALLNAAMAIVLLVTFLWSWFNR